MRLVAQGQYREAATLAQAMTVSHPKEAFGWKALGVVLKNLGRSADALAPMKKAVALAPGDAEAHSNLGSILGDLGRFDEAEASFRRALKIDPYSAEALYHLGIALNFLGRPDEAAASFRKVLKMKPGFADAHLNLAGTLKVLGRMDEALPHYRSALAASPSMLAARYGIYATLSTLVPQWHVPMMNEPRRNEAYFDALESAITPESEVFEIGTGSGLLAMMAAKLGARRVTTCESVPLIADAAQHIVARNGYEGTVKVVSKRSTDIILGEDLPRQADVLVCEIFSSELLGEHVLPSIEDAKRRLLKPGGRVIPAAGSIMVALFGGDDLGRNLKVADSFGFELQHFNSLVPDKQTIRRDDLDVEMLSDDTVGFRFDFESATSYPPESRTLRIPVTRSGRCHGVIQWIRLQMDKDVVFENHPSQKSAVSNWQRCAYVFRESIDVSPGQAVVVSASHNRTIPWFVLERIE
ncbi:MAG TPA: protein arginine N-methyltransferase [Usitatibacter sp.]|nr:protein arginine N-methyltransferase [Usitatibacter sp.]